jgi:hypothetical protein
MQVKLDKNGLNKKIKHNLLQDDQMKVLGFTNMVKEHWYYYKGLSGEITLNISIPNTKNKRLEINVLDESFLQPYDYQTILENNPQHFLANKIKGLVEDEMERLQVAGVITGFERGMYI